MFMKRIPLERIKPNPYQTRGRDDQEYIYKLAQDIKANGLLEMPAGRAVDADGKLCTYDETCQVQLAFGHNRWKAYQMLARESEQYEDLPVQIVTYDDERMALAAWSENESRKNLNPVERARAVLRMIESFGWTQDQAADKVRVARSTVSNMLRMLRLPAEVLDPLAEGALSERQAMAMMPFYDLGQLQRGLCLDDADFAEFMQIARQGMVDSETIRKKVAGKIEEHWPKDDAQAQPALPTEPVPETGVALPATEGVPEWIKQVGLRGEDEGTPAGAEDGSESEPAGQKGEGIPVPNPPFSSSSTLQDSGSVEEPVRSPCVEAAPASPHPNPLPQERTKEKETPAASPASPPPPPKTWAQSTIMLTVTLMPEDEQRDNRLAIIGGRVNDGAPLMEQRRVYAMDLGHDLMNLLIQLSHKYLEEPK